MKDKDTNYETETVECSQCLREIPASEAKSAEGIDYIAHFCGLECYDKWIKEKQQPEK